MRRLLVLPAVLGAACASAKPVVPVKPAGPSFEQKISWILRLEDERVLREPAPPPAAPPPRPARGQQAAPALVLPPPPPDLTRLAGDSEARVRRRAALAIGRVGLAEGIEPLLPLLASDPEAEVRQMAAFALGLIADRRATPALLAALSDPAPLVRGGAAEALGVIGDATAADPISRMVAQFIESGALAERPGDDDDMRRDTPSAACRLGIHALVRLKAFPALAAATLDPSGQPRARWWPLAYALQRLEDKRALPALVTLAKDSHPYTRAFAVKGLGALKDRAALPVLMPLLSSGERAVLVETIRALGKIGDESAAEPLQKIIRDANADPILKLEAVTAIGGLHGLAGAAPAGVIDELLDLVADPSPPLRAAALKSLAALEPENLVLVLSGLDPDPHWSVRASLATLLGTLSPEIAVPRLMLMLNDSDQRVLPSVLASVTKLKAPSAAAILLEHLKADDPVVRSAAADGLGDLKPANSAPALAEAYQFGQRDAIHTARSAALAALAKHGAATATPVLKAALADKDWAVRVRAVMLLKELDPAEGAAADAHIRPAPIALPAEVYQAARATNPSVSTQIYVETDRGTIQIEMAVLDAPLTVENFLSLARKGYFNGLSIHRVVPNFVIQDGDPRGDGEGGPGYTIRDEINELPYLRGTVGMALDAWRDTGGSQWFIAHSPQPHLDAKYTVFGRVVAGIDVVDKIQQWDVIRRIRVWDGQTLTSR